MVYNWFVGRNSQEKNVGDSISLPLLCIWFDMRRCLFWALIWNGQTIWYGHLLGITITSPNGQRWGDHPQRNLSKLSVFSCYRVGPSVGLLVIFRRNEVYLFYIIWRVFWAFHQLKRIGSGFYAEEDDELIDLNLIGLDWLFSPVDNEVEADKWVVAVYDSRDFNRIGPWNYCAYILMRPRNKLHRQLKLRRSFIHCILKSKGDGKISISLSNPGQATTIERLNSLFSRVVGETQK